MGVKSFSTVYNQVPESGFTQNYMIQALQLEALRFLSRGTLRKHMQVRKRELAQQKLDMYTKLQEELVKAAAEIRKVTHVRHCEFGPVIAQVEHLCHMAELDLYMENFFLENGDIQDDSLQ